MKIEKVRLPILNQQMINPILHGLLEIRCHMGGDQNDPPLSKSIKMIQTW